MPAPSRASWLRRTAMADEEGFIKELQAFRRTGEPLPSYHAWRLRELYKDMAEEFISSGITDLGAGIPSWNLPAVYQRVRELAGTTSDADVLDFALKHAGQYIAITGREGNWAGSSEMAALARAFDRPMLAFGNNWVTQDAIQLTKRENSEVQWEVLPYFEALVPDGRQVGVPVRVFQTNGGGHYQMLQEKPK
mmetsp:Transcript_37075/g.96402  ORF Transcript_37075/g.96402 Transcript_37075/m.96402 type:complete len:193 (+) Transcript_37075:2-580(+)